MKILFSFVLIFAFVVNSFGSPLVFKTSKEIIKNSAEDFQTLTIFDASKYKEVRIGVVVVKGESKKIGSLDVGFSIKFEAVESGDNMRIDNLLVQTDGSVNISNPPSLLRISTAETGIYKIYIWAQ